MTICHINYIFSYWWDTGIISSETTYKVIFSQEKQIQEKYGLKWGMILGKYDNVRKIILEKNIQKEKKFNSSGVRQTA